MAQRISSLDSGYKTGELSVFPEALDNTSTLYVAVNNAQTTLKHTLSYGGKTIVVEDATSFPPSGLVRVGPQEGPGMAEIIYYASRGTNQFNNLQRGFVKSRQNTWPAGTWVTQTVMAEYNNARKDAIIQMETDLGLEVAPSIASLNGILQALERRFLAPQPFFRAYPRQGVPPLSVRFQNFSGGQGIRFLWDFGDGSTSLDKSPLHVYLAEGVYTVQLTMVTSSGANGIATKVGYINVSNTNVTPFFYASPLQGYSSDTATALTLGGNPTIATQFTFVDQTDGNISQRYWIFGDGTTTQVEDPNVHTTTHVYDDPGTYQVSLFVVFADQPSRRAFLDDEITVF